MACSSPAPRVVRWYAGDDDWLASSVEFEQVLVGPDICAVVGDEDRDVAHDAYSKFFGSASERAPLVEEKELSKDVVVDARGQLGSRSSQCIGLTLTQGLLPL